MGTATTEVLNDPVYNSILKQTFDMESEQGKILWNYFRYGTPYDPEEKVYLDDEGNIVDAATAERAMKSGVLTDSQAEKELLKQGYKIKNRSDGSASIPIDRWWSSLPENTRDRYGSMDSAQAQAAYTKAYPGASNIVYKDPEGNVISAEDWQRSISQVVSDSSVAAGQTYTTKTRGEYEGYDPDAVTSEAELVQQGIEYQSRALKEREPLRTAFNAQALEGLDTEKYARQAASDTAQAYDASRQGLSTNLALRGAAPTEANMGDSMERASLIGGAKTQGRNWAETESFNRLSAALNAPA